MTRQVSSGRPLAARHIWHPSTPQFASRSGWCERRPTPITPGLPAAGGTDGCCWRATRRIACLRSVARASAPGSVTRWPWRGGCRKCVRGFSPPRSLDGYERERRPRIAAMTRTALIAGRLLTATTTPGAASAGLALRAHRRRTRARPKVSRRVAESATTATGAGCGAPPARGRAAAQPARQDGRWFGPASRGCAARRMGTARPRGGSVAWAAIRACRCPAPTWMRRAVDPSPRWLAGLDRWHLPRGRRSRRLAFGTLANAAHGSRACRRARPSGPIPRRRRPGTNAGHRVPPHHRPRFRLHCFRVGARWQLAT